MSWQNNNVILRFDKVTFQYEWQKRFLLQEAEWSIREHTKITVMGQNGAWKSTLFKLILWQLKPTSWRVILEKWKKIAIAKQVLARDLLELNLEQYFATAFEEKDYKLPQKIEKVLEEVNFTAPRDRKLKDYSWGQQARLLLAHALIQEPDILLLDEPTNNLDNDWINHLIGILLWYEKTVVVISHDADFLNIFTDWVLYLNSQNWKLEQYWWDYYYVVEQIAKQVEKEQSQNTRMEKKIADAKEKINFFANKGWKMRKLASKMRDEVAEAEENKVEVRKEDKTIKPFFIEFENATWPLISFNSLSLMNKQHEVTRRKFDLVLKKWERYLLVWPNWIWKSTMLKRLFQETDKDAKIHNEVRIGYYSQDFAALDFDKTVWESLHEVSDEVTDQQVYKAAAQFLLTSDMLKSKVGHLSEGQKWLLCYARFVIQKPHVLILDEPTNHINFRHIPVIAESLNTFKGAILMVSHDEKFLNDLEKYEIINLWKMIWLK